MEEQLKNLGKLLAVLEGELNLSATQINKAIATPLSFFPWAIKEVSVNSDNKLVGAAIARLDAQKGFPAMLTAPQQSIIISAYYAEKNKLSE